MNRGEKGAHQAQHLKFMSHAKKWEDIHRIVYQTQIPSEDNMRYTSLSSVNGLGCILSARHLIIIQALTED